MANEQMDAAAELAREELKKLLASGSAKEVAGWAKKWYMQAGYKRLGKVLKEEAS